MTTSVDLWSVTASRLQSLFNGNLEQGELSRKIEKYLRRLHHVLLEVDGNYQHAVVAFRDTNDTSSEQFWSWHSLVENSRLRGGMLCAFKNKPVPMHDHPGAHGVLLVIEGKVKVNRFSLERVSQNCMAQLASIDEEILDAGQTSIVGCQVGEIHSLESLSPRCVMLDVITPPYSEQERYWYFPVSRINDDGLLARRIHIGKSTRHSSLALDANVSRSGTRKEPGRFQS